MERFRFMAANFLQVSHPLLKDGESPSAVEDFFSSIGSSVIARSRNAAALTLY
jgi:hypothetical protein